MKSKFFMAAIAVAMIFASCSNEDKPEIDVVDNTEVYLTIKIAGATESRAIEAPGSSNPGTIQLQTGHIFVLSAADNVIQQVPLNVAAATGAGQVLGTKVAASSTVFVVGNVPAGVAETWTTLAQIRNAVQAIQTQDQYQRAALANVASTPAVIGNVTGTGDNKTATATVNINPVISRIELSQIRAKETSKITKFTVTGVFVDDYHPEFTWGGSFAGTMFEHGVGQIRPTDGYLGLARMHDRGTWIGDIEHPTRPLAAFPAAVGGESRFWAYNVAAGALPRLIIRLEGIEFTEDDVDDEGNPIIYTLKPNTDQEGVYYLTITGYTGVNTFKRGVIYRIGGEDGDVNAGIIFDEDDLTVHPNPDVVTLTVEVKINQWVVETPPGELGR
jgi:hypothetical protein